MLRRIASILFIAVALMSFAAPSSYAQDNYRHGRRSERRVYVVHRHEHRHVNRHVYRHVRRERGNKVVLRSHRNNTDVKLKVNF
ncbi:MAG: hypothetical protein P4L45_06705 [Ignavibacteriaceae bacterium]|nr:hypothetical protein [Ignavibacteriaceae bacterium]